MIGSWIVIPSGNGMRWLPDCLSALDRDLPADARVCLVDNASTDDSVAFVRSQFPRVYLLPLSRNLGFVQATNLGLLLGKKAGARNFVLLNNDTKVEPGWLAALEESARRHPDFGVFGAWQTDFQGRPSPRTKAILSAAPNQAGSIIETDWVEGSCLLFCGEMLDQIGYLDPVFAPAYFEEIDFCRRARHAGWKVGLVPSAKIQHFGAGSSLQAAGRRRQRILSERNYQVFHASRPGDGNPLGAGFLTRLVRHGVKAMRRGELSASEWVAALAGISVRMREIQSKTQRDRRNRPCPILGNRSRYTPEFRYYAECVSRIARGTNLSKCK